MTLAVVVAAGALSFGGCSSGDKVTDPAQPANFAGTYKGGYSSTRSPGAYTATLTVTQVGRDVNGTFVSSDNSGSTSVTGSVTGTRLVATFSVSGVCPSTGNAQIDLISNGTVVSGTTAVTDCVGSYITAFSLTKQ